MTSYNRHHTCHACSVARKEEFKQRRIEHRRSKGLPDHPKELTTREFCVLMGTFYGMLAIGAILVVCLNKMINWEG